MKRDRIDIQVQQNIPTDIYLHAYLIPPYHVSMVISRADSAGGREGAEHSYLVANTRYQDSLRVVWSGVETHLRELNSLTAAFEA